MLRHHQIDVYVTDIESHVAAGLAPLIALLTADERSALERFISPSARNQFLVGRALIRWLLAGRWAISPAQVALRTSPLGKPEAVAPPGRRPCRFNLSHCPTLAAVVLTDHLDVGIDVENTSRPLDYAALSAFCLSPDELQWFARQPSLDREAAFLRNWTLKEACVKCLGTGMVTGLQTVDCRFPTRPEPFSFHYPSPDGAPPSRMAAWQCRISDWEILSVVAAHQPAATPAIHLQLLKWLPGGRVLPMGLPMDQGHGAALPLTTPLPPGHDKRKDKA